MRSLVAGWLIAPMLLAAGCGGESPSRPPPAPEPPPAARFAPDPPKTPAPEVSVSMGPVEDAGRKAVRAYTKMFYEGKLEDLRAKFSDEMKSSVSLEQLKALHDQVREDYGRETAVVAERSAEKGKYRGFVRWARFDKHDGVIEIQWILRSDDSIAGFFIAPKEGAPKGAAK